MEREGQKLLHLESLRGIAALLVVFTHFAGSFFPAVTGGGRFPTHSAFDLVIYSTPLSILAGGNFAVCIFFVLSGFVLTRGYFLNGRIQQLQNSALKRYFRLMPAVAISVLLAYLLLRFQLFFNHDAAAITGSMGLDELWSFPANAAEATNQALYQAFITGTTGPRSYNPVLWTMQIEFLGSFLVFGAAALFGQHAKRHWMYLLLLIGTWQTYFLLHPWPHRPK
jgi:peptidoglycan/LPS O-acetylase OafA/YrhL